MALQVPQYLDGRSPKYLHNLMQATYLRAPQYGDGNYVSSCSQRPYDMNVCLWPERDGIRYGTFHSTNLLCKWVGVRCVGGHFYSKKFITNQTTYELRVGQFALGRHAGSYGVAVINSDDTQFISQSLNFWQNVMGDAMVLGAALASACVPVTEPFTRTVQVSPNNGSARRTEAEVVISTTTTETGMRTYCQNRDALPHTSPLVAPRLANWWTNIYASVAAYTHPNHSILPTDQMAAID